MLELLTNPKKEGGKHVEPGLGDVSEFSAETSSADQKKVRSRHPIISFLLLMILIPIDVSPSSCTYVTPLAESCRQARWNSRERTGESRVSKIKWEKNLLESFNKYWTVSEYSTENQEKEDKPKEEEAQEPVVEEKPKPRSSQPKEAAPAFMSNIFALLDVYLTKMLVSLHDT